MNGDGTADILPWIGPSTFKSYVIFEQGAPPWDNKLVRQAAALALDRQAIVDAVFPRAAPAAAQPHPG